MTHSVSGYLLGCGSNIEPFDNIAGMIRQLLQRFQIIHLSRIVHIPPVGMNSQHYFLNAVAFIETKMAHKQLKQLCNRIEISLGRDRDDPRSKLKDRPADIDIIARLTFPDDRERSARSLTDEYFLYPLIDELFAFLDKKATTQTLQKGVKIDIPGLTFGETATTIHRN